MAETITMPAEKHHIFGKLLSPAALVLSIGFIFALNVCGIVFGWYAAVPWLDSFHHAAGGGWIVLLSYYLVGRFPYLFVLPGTFAGRFIVLLAFTALSGTAWEIYEFVLFHLFGGEGALPPDFSHLDTILDLTFDLAGAAAVIVFVDRERRSS